ncbi:CBS domain-containing protein [Bradyrhizobium sp. RT9b]
MADALPMLRKAKDITMLEIPEDDDDGSVAMARGTNVAAWLARHGVTATARVAEAAGNEPAAVQLEKIAGDVGAGLIVAGAYGHSHFRELILGGVTHIWSRNPLAACCCRTDGRRTEMNRGGRAVYKFLEQTVGDYMTRDVRTVKRDLDLLELSEMFECDDFNSYPVEDDGEVVGIVTKFDILKCLAFTTSQMLPRYHDLMSRKVGDVMTPEFIYVSPDTKLTRVLQIMVEYRIRSIIVLNSRQKLVGIIAREDVIAARKATARD